MSQEYYKRLNPESRRLSYLPLTNIDHNIIPNPEVNNEIHGSMLTSKRASIISKKKQNLIGTPRLSSASTGAVNKLTRVFSTTGSASTPKVRGTRKSMAINMNRHMSLTERNKENEIDLLDDDSQKRQTATRVSIMNNNAYRYNNNVSTMIPNQNFSSQETNTSISNKDTRPLRDRSYQEKIRNEIFTFLNNNNFEMETKHLLTDRTLRNPTQKDFMVILMWLFRKIDPGYNGLSHIESDITTFLKIIQYPYLASITRSQISAAGGQNWYIFLGLLHWLVECIELLQKACNDQKSDDDPYVSIIGEKTDDREEEEDPVDTLNDLFHKYVTNAYKLFLMDDDDYDILKKELHLEFDQFSKNINFSIEKANNHFNYLSGIYKQSKTSFELIENGNKRTRALEGDIIKFKEYINSIEARKAKWQHNLEKLNNEVEKLTKQSADIEEEYSEIVSRLKDDGFELEDLKVLINDRKFIIQQVSNCGNDLEAKTKKLKASREFFDNQLDSLKSSISAFNDDAKLILSECSNSKFKSPINLTILLPKEEDINIDTTYLSIEDFFFRQELQTTMKNQLKSFHKELFECIFEDKDDIISIQNSIDLLSEKQNERLEHAASLESSLSSLKIQSEELYNTMNNESRKSKTEIDKLELQLQSVRSSLETNLIDIDQSIRYKEIELDNISMSVKNQKENLQMEVEKIIDYIISFKMDIQENLEVLGGFANKQHNNEVRVNDSFTLIENTKDSDTDVVSSDTDVKIPDAELFINDTNEATLNANEQ